MTRIDPRSTSVPALRQAAGNPVLESDPDPVLSPVLSVVFPVRLTAARGYLLPRLVHHLSGMRRCDGLELVTVDYGTPGELAPRLEESCAQHGCRYLKHPVSADAPFSIGAARDFGAQHARGDAVLFQDADFFAEVDFYARAVAFVRALNMRARATDFYLVPVLFLTADGTESFSTERADESITQLYSSYLAGRKGGSFGLALASSALLVNRLHLLGMGGHSEQFSGHGYEDYELLHRLACASGQYATPLDYFRDTRKDEHRPYAGFRPWFGVRGFEALCHGLRFVHLFHDRPDEPGYESRNLVNRDVALHAMRRFWKAPYRCAPKPDLGSDCRCLVLEVHADIDPWIAEQVISRLGAAESVTCEQLETRAQEPHIDDRCRHSIFAAWPLTEAELDAVAACARAGDQVVLFGRGNASAEPSVQQWWFRRLDGAVSPAEIAAAATATAADAAAHSPTRPRPPAAHRGPSGPATIQFTRVRGVWKHDLALEYPPDSGTERAPVLRWYEHGLSARGTHAWFVLRKAAIALYSRIPVRLER